MNIFIQILIVLYMIVNIILIISSSKVKNSVDDILVLNKLGVNSDQMKNQMKYPIIYMLLAFALLLDGIVIVAILFFTKYWYMSIYMICSIVIQSQLAKIDKWNINKIFSKVLSFINIGILIYIFLN